jgi:histidinol-phosphate/aromatic aminotransferase/cobyric acid decarboxylase-like protein
MRRCQDRHVLLRHFGGELAACIRISVGSPDENNRLLGALETLKES